MRIGINGRFLNQPITGVQRYARAVVEELDRAADSWGDVQFVLLTPRLKTPPPKLANIPIWQSGLLTGQLWEQIELPLQRDVDALLCLGNSAPAAALLTGRDVVTVVHDLSPQLYPQGYTIPFRAIYRMLVPLIMHRSRSVITVSESARAAILGRYPRVADRLRVIPNGGVPSTDGGELVAPVEGPYVLYVGSLSKLKNVDGVLEVARRMLADYPDYKFVLVGNHSGVLQRPRPSSSGVQNISSRLVFVGQVDDFSELARYYRHAAALVFPSHTESSGLPPVEAMAFGCPVVVSNLPALVERCGDAAVYCDPSRSDDIYAKLRSVLDDPELRAALAAGGRIRAERFTWQACASSILQILQALPLIPLQGRG